jgi:hypothetical protein
MRNPRSQSLLLALPLALMATASHAGPQDYYCDETATNDPPFPCWLVGAYKGTCPTSADTAKWDCVSAAGWVPNPSPLPGDPGAGSFVNAQTTLGAMAVSGDMPALGANPHGRSALLTIQSGDAGIDAPTTLLSLLQPGPNASVIELRLQPTPTSDGTALVVVRIDETAVGEPVVLATLPLATGVDHVRLNWAIDAVDGPVLGVATRNTRLKLPLPALDGATRLEITASAIASVILDLDARHHTIGTSDR